MHEAAHDAQSAEQVLRLLRSGSGGIVSRSVGRWRRQDGCSKGMTERKKVSGASACETTKLNSQLEFKTHLTLSQAMFLPYWSPASMKDSKPKTTPLMDFIVGFALNPTCSRIRPPKDAVDAKRRVDKRWASRRAQCQAVGSVNWEVKPEMSTRSHGKDGVYCYIEDRGSPEHPLTGWDDGPTTSGSSIS